MSAYKDNTRGTWFVKLQYKNWQGERKWVTKRGFKSKKDALNWEREFLLSKSNSPETPFAVFAEMYLDDRRPRIKESTMVTKENIIQNQIIPYFGRIPLREISTLDVMRWQNHLLTYRDHQTGKGFSESYLKTIHNQLSAIFNHAVRYYNLKENPAAKVGNMGTDKHVKMKFWTKEEYLKFAEFMMDDPCGYHAFQVLYWCGLREGEMLALTPADVDFEKKTISVTKTFMHLNGKDLTTEPKTPKSNRVVTMPDFLAMELKDYIAQNQIFISERLFPLTKSYLYRTMEKASAQVGISRIRVHDLRHSHVSLLIDLGYSAVAIADRMGHESIDITYRYAHLFPSVQIDMANKLNDVMEVC